MEGALSRQRVAPHEVDEVRQRVRERLFVAEPEGEPRIAEYRDGGPLGGWLRVAVVRTALNLRRNMDDRLAGRQGDDPAEFGLAGDDPEADLLRRRYREEFRAAFQEALRGLPAEGRNLLRMNLIDGMSIDQIGQLFRMSRSTASRRLGAAREAVVAETRRLLIERLRLSPTEMGALAAQVRSQLDLSLSRCLRPQG